MSEIAAAIEPLTGVLSEAGEIGGELSAAERGELLAYYDEDSKTLYLSFG